MKSSCHFFFNHLGMPTQFSDFNSPVFALHSTNLYSLISSIYFHWSSLSVSCQRIYNALTVDKSNHTLSLHRPPYNFSSTTTTQFSNSTCSLVWSGLSYRLSLYRHGTDHAENKVLLLRHASVWVPRDHYLGSPLARWLLPSNEL
jgi:hypothetical protein